MAFVPTVGMFVWFDQLARTSSIVKGLDPEQNLMWIRPIDGSQSRNAVVSDHWSEVIRHPIIVEVWFLAGPPGSGGQRWQGFFTRAAALAAVVDGTSVALMHVNSDGTVDPLEYFI